jgi:hypothetical protein
MTGVLGKENERGFLSTSEKQTSTGFDPPSQDNAEETGNNLKTSRQ